MAEMTMTVPTHFRIHGMDCAEEVAALKREVGPVVGGEHRLVFDILNGRMAVTAAGDVPSDAVVAAVARTGMSAELLSDTAVAPAGSLWDRHGRALLTAASGVCTLAGLTASVSTVGWSGAFGSEGMGLAAGPPAVAKAFFAAATVAGVWQVLPKAWFALRSVRPDMNLLMTVAVVGAVALGEWFEAATVSFLFAVSLVLESWSVGRARKAIAALVALAPPTVRVKDGDRTREEPAERVAVGTVFVVRGGEKVPLDGTVERGESGVDQAPITGESVPVPKGPGDPVYAGTINGDGVLDVRSTKAAADTTLAHIVRMVQSAQARRAPSEQWVERFARVYTPAVMAAAVLVAVVPPLAVGGEWSAWAYRSLVLLVIACPCALVISTPVSIVAAIANAARNGVLIKGGAFVEAPAHLKAIAFDKTGTLTAGKPRVVELVPLNGHDEKEMLDRAVALEAHSTHPIARAVVAYAASKGVTPVPAPDAQVLQGKGVTATIDGRPFWLGSHRYLEERGQETPDVHERLEAMTANGQTAVVVGNDKHVCGLIALADVARPEARESLQALRALGVGHLVMLTGDNRGTAEAIGREAGVDAIRAELLPADKVSAVEELVATYGSVAMVGDGVNDAPALGRATVGIAMGAVGTDAAIETADIALMADDLTKLPWLVAHSRRTLTVIRQNIGFALAVKAVFVALTFAGHASMWAAIAADAGASLAVIFNGLRLLRADRSRIS